MGNITGRQGREIVVANRPSIVDDDVQRVRDLPRCTVCRAKLIEQPCRACVLNGLVPGVVEAHARVKHHDPITREQVIRIHELHSEGMDRGNIASRMHLGLSLAGKIVAGGYDHLLRDNVGL